MKVMVIVKATQDSEAGVMPSEQLLTAMGQYNEESRQGSCSRVMGCILAQKE